MIPQIAKRTARENCWAEFRTRSDESFCIPHSLWIRRFSPLGIWEGEWKAFSPVELATRGPKRVQYRWIAQRDLGVSQQSWFGRQGSAVERRREMLSEWLKESEIDRTGIFRELLLGESTPSGLLLRELGFVHLLSVSGLHLLAIAYWISWILGSLLGFVRIPIRLTLAMKSLLTASAWTWCWLLSGAHPGVLRPLVLLGSRSIARRSGLRLKSGTPLVLAMLCDFGFGGVWAYLHHEAVLKALLDPGRIFYLFAVGAFVLLQNRKTTHLGLMLLAWLLTSVYQLLTHRLISLGTAVLSWVTIPSIAGVAYPLLVLRSLIPVPVNRAILFFDREIEALLSLCLSGHFLWWVSSTGVLLALVLASGIWLTPKKWRLHLGAASALGLVLLGFVDSSPSPSFVSADRVIQLDVGQGDAALVLQTGPGLSAGMIDTGSAKTIDETQWLQLFAELGIFRLDWVALTHLDEDHSGAILKISEILPIGCATTSEGELRTERGIRWKSLLESRGIQVTSRLAECIPFPFLLPAVRKARHSANENMSAYFIPLRSGGFYLSAGDATAKDEIRIGAWAESLGHSLRPGPRILKISHHGSKTSSDPEFLAEIRPTEAWISVGVANRYGHPSPVVLERLQSLHIPIHRTDEEGAIYR